MPPPIIYLDHNATTPHDPEVAGVLDRVSMEAFGNPGSRHSVGRRARQSLEDARELVASILGRVPAK